jgi:hypothetical protein
MPITNKEAIAECAQYVQRPPQQEPGICQLVQRLSLGLDDKIIVVEILEDVRGYTLLQSVRNGQLLIQREWETHFPWLQLPFREADNLSQYTAEVKNTWSYTSTPPHITS